MKKKQEIAKENVKNKNKNKIRRRRIKRIKKITIIRKNPEQ